MHLCHVFGHYFSLKCPDHCYSLQCNLGFSITYTPTGSFFSTYSIAYSFILTVKLFTCFFCFLKSLIHIFTGLAPSRYSGVCSNISSSGRLFQMPRGVHSQLTAVSQLQHNLEAEAESQSTQLVQEPVLGRQKLEQANRRGSMWTGLRVNNSKGQCFVSLPPISRSGSHSDASRKILFRFSQGEGKVAILK